METEKYGKVPVLMFENSVNLPALRSFSEAGCKSVSELLLPCALVLFCLLPCALGKYSGGTGTAGDPYRIADHNDIYALADDVNDYNKCFILTNDIDLNPNLPGRRTLTAALIAPDTNAKYDFQGTYFTGIFDGNNCKILNLRINGQDFIGLFGYIGSGGSVTNLGLEDVNITGTGSCVGGLVGSVSDANVMNCYAGGAVNGGYGVGGLVGYAYYASVMNCYATGSVTGIWFVGGLVGYSDVGSLTNCYATGAVKGDWYVGGLVGNADSYASVTNCYATGTVNGNHFVGGLVGYSYLSRVTESFWDVETSGVAVSSGGIGLTTSQMQQAFYYQANNWGGTTWTIDEGNDYPHLAWENTPDEFITDPVVSMAGSGTAEDPWVIESKDNFLLVCAGTFFWDKHYVLNTDIDLSGITYSRALIGNDTENLFTGSFNGGGHVISNLKIEGGAYLGLFSRIDSNASVCNLGLGDVNITGGDHVGGLVGVAEESSVMNCYATGAVTGSSDFVGGLVGYAEKVSLTNCYATGAVSGDYYVGGLVGYAHGDITNCYAISAVSGSGYDVGGLMGFVDYARVTNCYARGSVSGVDSIGGLVGYAFNATIKNCYATGAISGDGNYVGGLVGGTNAFPVTRSFWDVNTSGTTVSAGGVGLSTLQMQTQTTFTDAGWDFVDETINGPNDIWAICEGTNYPRFIWQIPAVDFVCPDGVTFPDYSFFSTWWLRDDCALNNDCEGADIDFSGAVDIADLQVFCNYWLEGASD